MNAAIVAIGESAFRAKLAADCDAAALRSVRVLDAWARKHGAQAPSPVYHEYMPADGPRWTISVPCAEVVVLRCATPDECREKAAHALMAEDSELLSGCQS